MRILRIFCLCVLFSAVIFGQTNSGTLSEVVAAENAFADFAAEKGTRAAFLEYAADNGLVFGAKFENAKEVWQKRNPASPVLLNWRPAWADVSAAGDIGYTTGPWSLHPKGAGSEAVAWGEYFTIWKKQPDGVWKWVLDVGIGHEAAEVPKNSWQSPRSPSGKGPSTAATADSWRTVETDLSQSLAKNGLQKSYEKYAAEQIRLLRHENFPLQGKKSALDFLSGKKAAIKTNVLGGESIADFAYAYGEYEAVAADGKTEKGHFVRVWKLGPKGWQIAADIELPPPPSAK
jgi:ketosteroid isomerase-like protein